MKTSIEVKENIYRKRKTRTLVGKDEKIKRKEPKKI